MSRSVAVGLVGAGPWASMVHAPVLARTPGLRLAGVWARRPEAAAELATKHSAAACATTAELFARCDAVAFAVPPGVQAVLAIEAAQAGCAVLLEKPIAADLSGAERLADEVGAAGVASMVVLSWRYAVAVRAFLEEAARFEAFGGVGHFLSAGMLAGPYRTPWRLDRGPLLDLGPHVVDLLDAALGPVVDVRASGALTDFVVLQLDHESGATSQATLSGTTAVEPHRAGVSLYGPDGVLEVDTATAVGPEAFATLGREFAEAAAGGPRHALDVGRGLHLQRVLDAAERQLVADR